MRRALALAAAKFFPRQPATIAAVTGTSGKTSVAAFTRQVWARLGHRRREHRHRRRGDADARGLWLAHDARSGRAATHPRCARRRRRDASRPGGLVPRARPASSRRRADRHRRLHQYQPRSSRLSRHHRRLFRGQDDPVRAPGAAPAARRWSRSTTSSHPRSRRAARRRGLDGDRGRAKVRATSASSTMRHRRLCPASHHRPCRQRPITCGCRWSARSRSRMRSSPPGRRSRRGGDPAAVFAALETLTGAKGRLELVGEQGRRADLRRLRPQARRARQGAGGAAPLCRPSPRRGVRRRRRPRRRQAPADGRHRRREGRPRHRHRRQSPQRGPRRDPRRDHERGARRRARSPTATRRSARRSPELERGDVLLVAGKGHETGQIIGHKIVPFSDHEAVATALATEATR